MNEILQFLENGITIKKTEDGYRVFTIKTQHFNITSLNELTVDRFNKAISDLKEREEWESKLCHLAFPAMTQEKRKN